MQQAAENNKPYGPPAAWGVGGRAVRCCGWADICLTHALSLFNCEWPGRISGDVESALNAVASVCGSGWVPYIWFAVLQKLDGLIPIVQASKSGPLEGQFTSLLYFPTQK